MTWKIVSDVDGANIGYRAIVDADGNTVCNPSPMGESNARLIANAPDMLTALQRLTHPEADESDVEFAVCVIGHFKFGLADTYIGGRFTGTPEDHFYADQVRATLVADTGEHCIYEFPDNTRCAVDGEGYVTHPPIWTVRDCKTLGQLAMRLNGLYANYVGQDIDQACDISDLPTFGGIAPADTSGIWSWDDRYFLKCHDVTGAWYLEPRI